MPIGFTEAGAFASAHLTSAQRQALPFFFVRFACADEMDGFVAILRVDLLHDAVDVVLDGEFGQVEVCGDFFVAQAHRDQRHQLALALGQLEAHAGALLGDGGFLVGLAGDGLEQNLAEF